MNMTAWLADAAVANHTTDDQRGGALLVTVLTAVLLSGLAGALVVVLSTEEAVEANHRRGVTALYAADGLLAGVVAELTAQPVWHAVLSGSRQSSFGTGPLQVILADGSSLDLGQETLTLQRALDQVGSAGVVPRWRLYAWGWFAELVGVAGSSTPRRGSETTGRIQTSIPNGTRTNTSWCVQRRSVRFGPGAVWRPQSAPRPAWSLSSPGDWCASGAPRWSARRGESPSW